MEGNGVAGRLGIGNTAVVRHVDFTSGDSEWRRTGANDIKECACIEKL